MENLTSNWILLWSISDLPMEYSDLSLVLLMYLRYFISLTFQSDGKGYTDTALHTVGIWVVTYDFLCWIPFKLADFQSLLIIAAVC